MSHATIHDASQGSAAALLERADALPLLDAEVDAFLDTVARGKAEPSAAEAGSLVLPHAEDDRAALATTALPLLVYLSVAAEDVPARGTMLQLVANRLSGAVLHIVLQPRDDVRAVRSRLESGLAAIAPGRGGIDTGCFALAGDGLGAALALALVLDRSGPVRDCGLLILATPILSQPSLTPGTSWMPAERATALAARRIPIEPRLARVDAMALPPILSITAEADPFRDGAEALTRRLMAAGAEVAAFRGLGTIHDFTWLPALVDSPPSANTRQMIADAIRRHLSPQKRKLFHADAA